MSTDRSRRRFVGTAAVAAAWPLLGRTGAAVSVAPAAGHGPLKLGVASYSMREFTLDQALDMAKKMGVTHMTFKDVHIPRTDPPEATRALRAKIEAAGITIMGGGTITIPNDPARIKKEFEYAKNAGFPLIFIDPEPAALDAIEAMARSSDIKVAIHNHPKGQSIYWNPESVLAAIKGRTPLIGACADVGHWIRSGLDPLECLKKLDGHILSLHFKDLNEMGPNAHDVPWGTGVGRTKELMVELQRQHFRGVICVEYEYNWESSSPEIAQSIKFFNKICDELVG